MGQDTYICDLCKTPVNENEKGETISGKPAHEDCLEGLA